ncbi:MAG: hypothetical protein LBU91_03080 [Bacteroidales bacterium]|jgi:hypothetical protein|nr:hypothetical protein [Bacteroidales bacterium]
MRKIVSIIGLLITAFALQAQDEPSDDFKIGAVSFGVGGFMPGKYVANYYSGSNANINKILYIFENKYRYNEVKQELGGYDFNRWTTPEKMRYKLATAISFRASLNTSAHTSFFIHVNKLNLVATDIFTIDLDMPIGLQLDYKQHKIWGKESRTMLDVGFQQLSEMNAQHVSWFYELAFNLTNTKVLENSIEIGKLTYSILNGEQNFLTPGDPFQAWEPEIATGVGISASLGWRYAPLPQASIDFGVTGYMQDINLEGYKKFHPSFNLFMRVNLLMF